MADTPSPFLAGCRELFQGLLHLFYPCICWVCQRPQTPEQPAICDHCAHLLGNDPHATCPRCSSTVGQFIDLTHGCPACHDSPLLFDRTLRMGHYDGLLREVVLRMKHRQGERLADILAIFWAQRIADRVRELAPDVVIPLPLHWIRRWQRGFNQSEVLARRLALKLGIPCKPGWLRRVLPTPKLAALSGPARWQTIKGAFALGRGADVAGKTVLLVDDVLTSGATASEAARVLKPLRPRNIVVAVVAHGRPPAAAT